MNNKLIHEVKLFVERGEKLYQQGVKKKDVAHALGIYPSVYSTLLNVIFKKIMDTPNLTDDDVREIFSSVNNISEKNTRRDLEKHNAILLEMLENLSATLPAVAPVQKYIDRLLDHSPVKILKQLAGLYDCYYLSTTGYKVKREPFWIREGASAHQFMVFKGNALSVSRYEGFLYISHNYVLTVQLQELETMNPDNFIIHFQLSPYPKLFSMLKGISTSISNIYSPVSRKIILTKVSETTNRETFEAIQTLYFDKETLPSHPEIVQYLYRTNSIMEYTPIPRPEFNEKDLLREMRIEASLL